MTRTSGGAGAAAPGAHAWSPWVGCAVQRRQARLDRLGEAGHRVADLGELAAVAGARRAPSAGLGAGGADDRVRLAARGDPDQLGVELGLGGQQLGAAGGLGLEGGEVLQGGVLRVAQPLDRRVGDLLHASRRGSRVLDGRRSAGHAGSGELRGVSAVVGIGAAWLTVVVEVTEAALGGHGITGQVGDRHDRRARRSGVGSASARASGSWPAAGLRRSAGSACGGGSALRRRLGPAPRGGLRPRACAAAGDRHGPARARARRSPRPRARRSTLGLGLDDRLGLGLGVGLELGSGTLGTAATASRGRRQRRRGRSAGPAGWRSRPGRGGRSAPRASRSSTDGRRLDRVDLLVHHWLPRPCWPAARSASSGSKFGGYADAARSGRCGRSTGSRGSEPSAAFGYSWREQVVAVARRC